MEYTLRASAELPAPAGDVFDVITDIDHLPDWNLEIPRVVESPGILEVGSEWVVEIHALKSRWNSRARVLDLDRAAGRFGYRSQSDDGNASYAEWRWQLTPAGSGGDTSVSVEVDVRPRTFWRKWLLSRLRRTSLRKAMHESLASLRQRVSVS
ncbi:MAG: SRPBCC family protein [Acidimicrobiales bacterium]